MAQTKRSKTTSSKNKKTNTKGRSTAKKRQSQSASPEIKNEVIFILFVVLCVLMFISCFGIAGPFGNLISNVLFGLFGLFAYIVPAALFVGACFFATNKENVIAIFKVIAGVVAVFVLCGLLHGITGNRSFEPIIEAYEYSALYHKSAGLVGAAVFTMLASVFGTVGSYVVLIALLIASMVLISEKSFVKEVKKGSRKVYDTAKEENIKRKERAEERRERRLEKKASGVDMDVKLEKDTSRKENMTELLEQKKDSKEEIFLSPEMSEIPVHNAKKVKKEKEIQPEIKQEIPVRISSEPVFVQEESEDIPVVMEEKPVVRRKKKAESAEEIVVPEITETVPAKQYQFPPLRLLTPPKGGANKNSAAQLRETAAKLQKIK